MRYNPAPDSPEEQKGAGEGQAPTSLYRVPIPYWLWCCPCSAHRGQWTQGRAGRGVPERVPWSPALPVL